MTTSPTHSDGDFADAMDGSEQQQLSTDHPSSSADDSPASVPLPDSRHGSVTSEVPRDVSSDQSYQSQRHASSSSATGSKAAPRTAPGVAALMARFQKGMSSSSTSSVTSSSSVKTDSKSSWSQSRDASGSTGQRSPDASGSASQKSLDAPVSTGQASLDDPREAQSIDAPVADQIQSIDAFSVPRTHTEDTTATKGSTDGSRDVASVTSDGISSADPDNTHAQKLAPDETKIPPSEGAVSLLDPQTTIENPFHSDDLDETSISSDTNHNLQSPPSTPKPSSAPLAGPNSLSPSRRSITSSVADSTNTMSPHSTTRFSEISLSSGVPARASYAADPSDSSSRRSSKRATVTTIGERETLADPLEDAKRFSSQDKDLPAPSLEGMEKLRENFEKLHQQQQQKRNSHSRQHSNATDSSEKGHPGPSSLREEGQANSDLNGHLTGDTTITTLNQDSEEVDWDFWGKVMSSKFPRRFRRSFTSPAHCFTTITDYHEVAHENPHDLSRAIQAGIPAQLRGLCWQLLSASKDEEMEIIYAYYIRQNSPHEKQIRKDLSRTFPQQDYFKDVKGVGQDNLFNVVKAYSLYDEECGYCQGMQFIVGPLLMHMPDEEAFSTLVRLMKSVSRRHGEWMRQIAPKAQSSCIAPLHSMASEGTLYPTCQACNFDCSNLTDSSRTYSPCCIDTSPDKVSKQACTQVSGL